MGRFHIIETTTHSPSFISHDVAPRRRGLASKVGPMSIVLAAFLTYFGPALTGGASARAGPPQEAIKAPEMRQYHSLRASQYHRVTRSSAPGSASLSRSGEFVNSISGRVISRFFTPHSRKSISKVVIRDSSRSAVRIGRQNGPPISRQIAAENGRDPRLMLDIAKALGLVYLAFLAVWFWATRFRMRPPSSAPS
jgi:hypothetical protein